MKILMVVAPKNFRDEELFEPKEILEKAGAQITIASKGVTEAGGMFGGKVIVDKDLSEVKLDEYDTIVFIGGSGSAIYFNDQTVLGLAKKAYEANKIVGAICIAPSILANAGILEGKKATAFSSEAENLKTKGAQYTGENVTIDGKIITASGPQAAKEFGEEVVKALNQ
jgi:protease I